MSIGERTMTAIGSNRTYILGSKDLEHERLIRQAAYLAPTAEQFFREATIGRGQRVLTSAPASETWPFADTSAGTCVVGGARSRRRS
jgi:hypothetical protein